MDRPPNEELFSDLLSPMVDGHMRLRDGSETLGYVKSVASVKFFSKDRYSWSGEPIDYVEGDPWSGFFDLNRIPVYRNDLVWVREGVFASKPMQAAVMGNEVEGVYIQALKTGEKLPLQDPFSPRLGWNDLRVIGQLYRNATLWERLYPSKEVHRPIEFPKPTLWGGVHLVGWQLTFLVGAVLAQWKMTGSVGPLLPSMGIWVGSWVGIWRHRANHGPVLSRARVRHLAVRGASGLAAVGTVGYGALEGLGYSFQAVGYALWWAPLLLGFSMGLVSLISLLTAADTYTLVIGGYDGETPIPVQEDRED